MNLRTDFEAAWRQGEHHDTLLDLVHRQQSLGLSAQEVYQVLQDIWLAYSFDKGESDDALRDNLEYVMEKVWYESPLAR